MRVTFAWFTPITVRVLNSNLYTMCADIYRTATTNTFLLVPRGTSLKAVPKEVLEGLGHCEFLKSRELDDPLLSVDTTGINSELARQGFSVRSS